MEKVVNLYFSDSDISDDVISLIQSWVVFFQRCWDDLFYLDKDVILRLEFFLDNKKIVKNNAPPNNDVYMYEMQRNPEIVLKFMKVALHLLLFHLLDLKEETAHKKKSLDYSQSVEKGTFGNMMKEQRKNKRSKTFTWSSLFTNRENNCFNFEITNQLINELKNDRYKNCETFLNYFLSRKITIYLYHWNKTDTFENVKSEKVNQLICLRGCVLRVSPVKLLIENLDFVCEKCKRVINVEFVDGKYSSPKNCCSVYCDSRVFYPVRESARSTEYQKITLKEDEKVISNMYEVNYFNSHNLTVTLEVSKYFVNTIFPGNHVEALGILKVISLNTNYLINGKNSLFNMFIDCLSVFPISSKKYLNTNYFILQKIKEAKNKLYSSVLWESYVDKFQKKRNAFIRKKKKEERQIENIQSGSNIPNSNNSDLYNAPQNMYATTKVYENDYLNVSDEEKESKKHKNKRSIPDAARISKPRKLELNKNVNEELQMLDTSMRCMFDECIIDSSELENNGFHSNNGKKKKRKNEISDSEHFHNCNDYDKEEHVEESEKDAFNDDDDFDSKSLDFIQEIYSNEKNKFYLLVASFCPRIMISNYIKAGILLSLLGGKTLYDEFNEIKRRGNIHCLLIGDPGIGKSRLLRYVNNVIEKSIFICSTSASINGLTACAIKDSVSNEYALEGGALVLSDKGICCIDELDKISLNEQQSFLECMENQSINITKAGIVCNLKARCSIIAASNPKEGKYNLKKSIFDNIKISFPLLSRFDLVFLLTDQISEEKDQRITDILVNSKYSKEDDPFFSISNERHMSSNSYSTKDSMIHKCKQINEENYLPLELIGVFIKYSRKYISPVLSEEAKQYIKHFYLHLRNLSLANSDISIPITIRQLEALIRLCQGRARADLSKIVTIKHAQEVVEIYQKTIFYPLFLKSLYQKNPKTKVGPRGKSAVALSRPFKQRVIQLARETNNKILNKDMRSLAQSIIMEADSDICPDTLIDVVNNEGFILYKGSYWEVNFF